MDKRIVLNITKVQKLLFIAYGYCLAKHNRVILDERPKAWPYGPVFPKTRNKVDFSKVPTLDDIEFSEISQDDIVKEVFNMAIDKYSEYSASKLTSWSHMPGGPWDMTTKSEGFDWNNPIPDEYIKEYFSNIDV